MTDDVNGQDEAGSTADERERDTGSRFRRRTAIKTLGMANLAGLTGLAGCIDAEEFESEAEDVQEEVESEAEEITIEARRESKSDNYPFIISALVPTMVTPNPGNDKNPKLITRENNNMEENISGLVQNWTRAGITQPDLIVNPRDVGGGKVEIPVNIVLTTTAPEVDGVGVTVGVNPKDGGDLDGDGSGLFGEVSGGNIKTDTGVKTVTRLSAANEVEAEGPPTIEYDPNDAKFQGIISANLDFTFDFAESTVFSFDKEFKKTYKTWILIDPLQDIANSTFQTAADARTVAEKSLGATTNKNTKFLSKATTMYVLTAGGQSMDISNEYIDEGDMRRNVFIDGIMGIDKTLQDGIDEIKKENSDYAVRHLGPTFTYNGEDLSASTEQAESNTEDPQETQNVSRSSGWEKSTRSDASVEVLDSSELDLRVYRCANASATRQYESNGGEITISFDYEVEAEGWYEVPYIRVRQDDEITHRSDSGEVFPQIKPKQFSTTTGSFAQTISVSGPFEIVVGIKPSQPCGNADHENTYFRVDNLTVD